MADLGRHCWNNVHNELIQKSFNDIRILTVKKIS